MVVERGLVDKAPPGTRVTVLAVASLFNSGGGDSSGGGGAGSKHSSDTVGVRTTYLRVVGMERVLMQHIIPSCSTKDGF